MQKMLFEVIFLFHNAYLSIICGMLIPFLKFLFRYAYLSIICGIAIPFILWSMPIEWHWSSDFMGHMFLCAITSCFVFMCFSFVKKTYLFLIFLSLCCVTVLYFKDIRECFELFIVIFISGIVGVFIAKE